MPNALTRSSTERWKRLGCRPPGPPRSAPLGYTPGSRKAGTQLPSSKSSRRAILLSVIGVILGFELCLANPTLPSPPRWPPLWVSGPPAPDSWRLLRRATYPQLLHHVPGHDPPRRQAADIQESRRWLRNVQVLGCRHQAAVPGNCYERRSSQSSIGRHEAFFALPLSSFAVCVRLAGILSLMRLRRRSPTTLASTKDGSHAWAVSQPALARCRNETQPRK